MPRFLTELLPQNVNCPHCGAGMALNDEERTFKRFKCPACKRKIDLRTQVSGEPITNAALLFNNNRKPGSGLGPNSPMSPNFPPPGEIHRGPARPRLSFLPHKRHKR